jgi:release factor glutamine methyltransferase
VADALAVSVRGALRSGHDALARAGCDTPRLDAELLLAEALGVGRERLVLERDQVVGGAELTQYEELVLRRASREPVAFILGRKEFRRITLEVDRRVLIPRPETELLVELGLGLAAGARVVDVGTGSGAIALALKDERPDLIVRGLDISADAVAVARSNAARLGLEVVFDCCHLLDDGRYDAVLANLPYVRDGAVLEPEIASYEPVGALFAGSEGLELIASLVSRVASAASRPQLLAMEIDPAQAEAVIALVRQAGFGAIDVLRDLAGHDRVVVGRA